MNKWRHGTGYEEVEGNYVSGWHTCSLDGDKKQEIGENINMYK